MCAIHPWVVCSALRFGGCRAGTVHNPLPSQFDPTSPKSHTRNSAEARRRASRSADRASHGAPATHATAQAAALSPAPLQGPAPAPGPSARPVGPTAAPQPRQGSRQEGLVSTDRHRPGSFLSRLSVKGQDLLHRVSRAVTRTKEEEGPSRREERGDGDGNGEEAGTAKAAMQRWMAGLFEVRRGCSHAAVAGGCIVVDCFIVIDG